MMNLPSKNVPVNHLWWHRPYLSVLEPLLDWLNSVKLLRKIGMTFFLWNSDSFFFYFLFHFLMRLPHSLLFVGQDQQDWLIGWKLTDLLERRMQWIEWWMMRKGWTPLGWPRALLLFPSSWTLLMEGTERIDYTEQLSPNSPRWKGRMWTDGTKEELSTTGNINVDRWDQEPRMEPKSMKGETL